MCRLTGLSAPVCFFVRMNAKNSVIIHVRDTKFGMQISVYHIQIKYTLHIKCHGYRHVN